MTAQPEPFTDNREAEAESRAVPLRVVALVNNPCIVDARVIRGAEALAEAGHEVLVLAHWNEAAPERESRNGVQYHRLPVRHRHKVRKGLAEGVITPAGARSSVPDSHPAAAPGPVASATRAGWLAFRQARRYSLSAALHARKLLYQFRRLDSVLFALDILQHARAFPPVAQEFRPDVVHAHDLYTLLAGRRIAQRTGARLVYDSHELEIGRNGNYSKLNRALRGMVERRLIEKADAVITVSDSIADFLARRYGIPRPQVVHNAPSIGRFDAAATDIRRQLGLAPGTPLALYIGGVTINRGVENCVRALAHAPDLHLACIGKRNAGVEATMLADAARLGVRDRLHLVDPVPHDQVTAFVRTGDVSLIPIQDVCLSYRFCFPNKLMESLLTGLPVVVARLVELERIVARTGAGLVVDETDPSAIAQGIMQIVADRATYVPSPAQMEELAAEFGWPAQKARLLGLYADL